MNKVDKKRMTRDLSLSISERMCKDIFDAKYLKEVKKGLKLLEEYKKLIPSQVWAVFHNTELNHFLHTSTYLNIREPNEYTKTFKQDLGMYNKEYSMDLMKVEGYTIETLPSARTATVESESLTKKLTAHCQKLYDMRRDRICKKSDLVDTFKACYNVGKLKEAFKGIDKYLPKDLMTPKQLPALVPMTVEELMET